MKNITKNFTQKYVAQDCEGRYWKWEDTNEIYETLEKKYLEKRDSYVNAIREVEKTFDPETFKITLKTIRGREWEYNWDTHERKFVEMKIEG